MFPPRRTERSGNGEKRPPPVSARSSTESSIPSARKPATARRAPPSGHHFSWGRSEEAFDRLATASDAIREAHLWREQRLLISYIPFSDTSVTAIAGAGLEIPEHHRFGEIRRNAPANARAPRGERNAPRTPRGQRRCPRTTPAPCPPDGAASTPVAHRRFARTFVRLIPPPFPRSPPSFAPRRVGERPATPPIPHLRMCFGKPSIRVDACNPAATYRLPLPIDKMPVFRRLSQRTKPLNAVYIHNKKFRDATETTAFGPCLCPEPRPKSDLIKRPSGSEKRTNDRTATG